MIPKPLIEEAKRQIDGTYNVQYNPVVAQLATHTANKRELLVKTGMSDDQHLLLESLEISPITIQ